MDGTNMHVAIESPRINLPHFIPIVGGIIVNAFILGGVWVNLGNTIEKQSEQISDINDRISQEATERKSELSNIQQQMNQIPSLAFQTTKALEVSAENKKTIEEVNSKIGSKLDSLIDQINRLSTQVQVLGSKFDDMQGKTDHTIFPRLPISAQN